MSDGRELIRRQNAEARERLNEMNRLIDESTATIREMQTELADEARIARERKLRATAIRIAHRALSLVVGSDRAAEIVALAGDVGELIERW